MTRSGLVAALAAMTLAACRSAEPPAPVATAGTGEVDGRAVFRGVAPPRHVFAVTEPACRARHPHGIDSEEVVLSRDGSLANVFVYVKTGLPEHRYAPPAEPARLVQSGCQYLPHVLGVMTGQPLELVNADPVLHNLHALAKHGRPFNVAMPPRRTPWSVRRAFDASEVMVRVRCDVHPWMHCWIGVLPHPFYAVSAAGGRFAIRGLPPGTYEVEAWHETFGTRSARITVTAGRTAGLTFTFTPTGARG